MTHLDPNGIKATGATMSGMGEQERSLGGSTGWGAESCRRYPGGADIYRDNFGNTWMENADTHIHVDLALLGDPAARRFVEEAYVLKEECPAYLFEAKAMHAVRRESPLPRWGRTETVAAVTRPVEMYVRRPINAEHRVHEHFSWRPTAVSDLRQEG